jgi:hypothetical protein
MKPGRSIILLLTLVFLVSEIVFFYLLSGSLTEFLDFFGKTALILIFILLFTRKLNWARWILSVLLFLLGALYVAEALVDGTTLLLPIGLYDIFFATYIHFSKALAGFRTGNHPNEKVAPVAEPLPPFANQNFPHLKKRYQALLADGVLMMTILIVGMVVLGDSEYRPPVMITLGSILFFLYEPLLTAYSGTVGQKMMKLKVRQFDQPDKRLSLLNAYLRWITKALLGWLSFLTINFNKEHRAIHDFASNSIMLDDN